MLNNNYSYRKLHFYSKVWTKEPAVNFQLPRGKVMIPSEYQMNAKHWSAMQIKSSRMPFVAGELFQRRIQDMMQN